MQESLKRSKKLFLVIAFLLVLLPVTNFTSSAQAQNEITYIGLGDSLAEGLLEGDKGFSETEGYFGHIKETLRNNGYKVNDKNYSKSGANSIDVLNQTENLSKYPNGADIITISVGANDILPKLSPLIEEGFQNKITKAQATLLDFQEDMNNAEDVIVKTGESLNQLITDLDTLQNVVKKTMTDLDNDPLFQQSSEADNILKEIQVFLDSLEGIEEELETIAMELPLPEEELNQDKLLSLLIELPDVFIALNKELDIMEDIITNTIDTINEIQLPQELEETYRSHINEANTTLEILQNSIMKTHTHVNNSLETLQNISASLNEVFEALETIEAGLQKIEEVLQNAYSELETIGDNLYATIEKAKAANPDVDIYVLGYYNALPYTSEEFQEAAIHLLVSLNKVIEETSLAAGANYVPSYDAFEGRHNELLPNPSDIHPNEAGYRVLADQFILAINEDYPEVLVGEKEDPEQTEKPNGEEQAGTKTPKEEKINNEKIEIVEKEEAVHAEVEKDSEPRTTLPATATDYYNVLLIGIVFIGLSIFTMIIARRQRRNI